MNLTDNTKKSNFYYLMLLAAIAAFGGFLFGFDTAVISGTISFVKNKFVLDSVAEGWFVSSALVGCIIGVSASGFLSDSFGRKKVLFVSAFLFLISAIGCALTQTHTALIIYRLVGGLGVGIASMVSPLYISEISPAKFRGRMVALYQLAITIGILTAYFSNAYIQNQAIVAEQHSESIFNFLFKDEIWRGMFAAETIPAFLFLLMIFIIPESPRWLVIKNKEENAKKTLLKLGGETFAINQINAVKDSLKNDTGSLKQLFQPGFRTALFIGVVIMLLSQFSGINAIIYYGPKILNEAGFTLGDALGGQVTIGIVNVLFTFVAILTVDKFGRRPVLIIGVIGIVIAQIAVGTLFYLDMANSWLLLVSILFFIACFAFSFGPVGWIIVNEIFPNSIRGKAVSIATLAVWVGTALIGQFVPFLLENISPAGTFWLFAVLASPTIIITWKIIPETKGRSLEEIEKHWLSYQD
ncbi:MAG: MFS transporter [Bacteroidetes bacterium 4572_117]|nr:MAG: MFS transporter [Bacteroidetes bacterium 4572_117]